MSARHRFLTTKDLHWQWFNPLAFGMVPESEGGVNPREAALQLDKMKAAALHYTKSAGGWSEEIGLFFNVFGHNNVNSLFLHVVDMSVLGPGFNANSHKNCPLDD